jgi:hypothetical protein
MEHQKEPFRIRPDARLFLGCSNIPKIADRPCEVYHRMIIAKLNNPAQRIHCFNAADANKKRG